MQQASDGIQSFVDALGGRWRAIADARRALEAVVVPWIAADGSGAPLVPLKKSRRREVYAATAAGLPPLLLKRYPPRAGLLGRGRDRLGTRAAAEFKTSRRIESLGLLTPRALGCVEPAASAGARPSWFVGVRMIGARPLGTWLEERFRPGDGAANKLKIARRALDLLDRLHQAGIWHRDFHGGNLLLHEGEGPAAALYLIDLHSAIDLTALPARLRARDAAVFLHSLRYAFAEPEVEALVADAPRWRLEPAALRSALERRRETQARSRGARAFVESSRFAQARLGERRVSHDRSLELPAIETLLAGHEAALVRVGRRSRISRQTMLGGGGEPTGGGDVIVKEFLGRLAGRKARAAFGNGVAAQARDLPVAAPLACVIGPTGEPAFALARAVEGATPLHLLAQRVARTDGERALAAGVAQRLLELLVALVKRRFVHPDLSPKNLLVRGNEPVGAGAAGAGAGKEGPAVDVVLVDLDAARPGASWTRRRLLRALAQLGDVPAHAFSKTQRLRFLDALRERLGLSVGRGPLARATARLLEKRRKLPPQGAPRHELAEPRTLHFFGNWKWTGPAEPAVALAAALKPHARLLLGRCPFADLGQPVAEKAAARGVPHELLESLRKHWNPLFTGSAAAEALPIARSHAPAAIHVHLDGDHAVALALASALPQRPGLVRHVHAAGPHPLRTRRLLRQAELLVAPTIGLARALERELAMPDHGIAVLETSVDLDRFQFTEERRARGRTRLGLAADDVAFGIVARIQPHRRFELLFDAWAKLREQAGGGATRLPKLPKLVVLGRGTLEEELAHAPVKRLGLESLVLLPGYQQGEAYVEALAACDAGIFLVPGSDVSCRAVREWMAMGRAVVATRRAPLPELIDDGIDGALVDEDAVALAAVVRELADPAKLARAGAQAAGKARRRFDPRWLRSSAMALDRMAALAVAGTAASFRGAAKVVAAVRPGRLDALLRLVQDEGGEPESVLAFDPARSRDAVLDLFALLHAARPRQLLLEPHAELDATIADELARLALQVRLVVPIGKTAAARAHPLARFVGVVEA